jgi:hypothetical protein
VLVKPQNFAITGAPELFIIPCLEEPENMFQELDLFPSSGKNEKTANLVVFQKK